MSHLIKKVEINTFKTVYYDICNHYIMSSHVSIAIFGCVSAGKSTLLKAILGDDYTPSKKKKATMGPQIYRENKNKPLINTVEIDIKAIREINDVRNEEILKKMNEGHKLEISDIQPIVHEIDLIDRFLDRTKMNGNTYLELYDIPGLNDSISKDIFFQWIRENFSKFDIVVFVTDLDKGLNNSDEMDILNLLIGCIKIEATKGKMISIIPVLNKCDNVRYDKEKNEMTFKSEEDDSSSDDENYDFEEDDNEDEEVYNQANTILQLKMKELENIRTSSHVKFIPLSAELALIYTMILKCIDEEKGIKISSQYLNVLGEYECGKKTWKSCTKKEKVETINEIVGKLSKKKKENDSLYNTGYYYLRDIVQKIIERNEAEYAYNHFLERVHAECEFTDIDSYLIDLRKKVDEQLQLVKDYKMEFRKELVDKTRIILSNYFTQQIEEINRIIIADEIFKSNKVTFATYIKLEDKLLKTLQFHPKLADELKRFPENVRSDLMNLNDTKMQESQDILMSIMKKSLLEYEWNDEYHSHSRVCVVLSHMMNWSHVIFKEFIKRLMALNGEKFYKFISSIDLKSVNVITIGKNAYSRDKDSYDQMLFGILFKYIRVSCATLTVNNAIEYCFVLERQLASYRMTKKIHYFRVIQEQVNDQIKKNSVHYLEMINTSISNSVPHEFWSPKNEIEQHLMMNLFS